MVECNKIGNGIMNNGFIQAAEYNDYQASRLYSEKLNLMESFNRKKNSPGQEQRKNHFPVVKPINSQDPDEKFLLYGKGS